MLHVRQLESGYGESLVIRGVNLEVGEGQVVCVLGRNGVGKTTLLKTIMGILKTRAGEVEFAGRRMTKEGPHVRARAGMGYVPQGRDIFPQLTVQENLLLGLEAGRAEGGTIPEDIYAMFPSLPSLLKRRGGDLSGGQQQQLAIARALVMRPRLLILDEPTEGIQPSIIKAIERAVRTLLERGDMAILLVEQYYDFARALADRYAIMSRGQIVLEGLGSEMDADDVRRLVTV